MIGARTPCLPLRVWRLYIRRSPLVRPCDRAERLLIGIALLVALIAVPICAAFGSETTSRGIDRAHQEAGSRYPDRAVTAEAAPVSMSSVGREAGRAALVPVAVTWTAADHTVRSGHLPVRPRTPTGSPVPVWLDANGNLTSPPLRPVDAISTGVLHAVGTWLGAVAALAAGCWAARRLLDRQRYARWAREWDQLDPDSERS